MWHQRVLRNVRWLALLALVVLAAPIAAAHVVVVAGPGDSLANATALPSPPARVFDELAPSGGLHYYKLDLGAGATARVRLAAGVGAFADPTSKPLVLIAGPGLPNDTFVPPGVDVPDGAGQIVLFAGDRQAQRAAWVPLALDVVVDREWTAPQAATYYVVVYSAEGGGPFSLWIEPKDAFSLVDWFSIATLRSAAHDWQGGAVLSRYVAGALGALALAAPLVVRAGGRGAWSAPFALGIAATALFGASAGLTALLAWAAGGAASWLPVAACAAVGATSAALLWRSGRLGAWRRAGAIAVGLAGLALFAGFLWGPVALVAAGILPDEVRA